MDAHDYDHDYEYELRAPIGFVLRVSADRFSLVGARNRARSCSRSRARPLIGSIAVPIQPG